jgi:hypothetical protein
MYQILWASTECLTDNIYHYLPGSRSGPAPPTAYNAPLPFSLLRYVAAEKWALDTSNLALDLYLGIDQGILDVKPQLNRKIQLAQHINTQRFSS